jgi:hypothetical protein
MFPNRVPMGSDTPSPGPLVYVSFIHVCLPEFPKKEPSYIHMGKNIRSPSTETEGLHTMECGLVPQGRCRGCRCT